MMRNGKNGQKVREIKVSGRARQWWCTLKAEAGGFYEFKASLVYRVSSRKTQKLQRNLVLKNQNKQTNKNLRKNIRKEERERGKRGREGGMEAERSVFPIKSASLEI